MAQSSIASKCFSLLMACLFVSASDIANSSTAGDDTPTKLGGYFQEHWTTRDGLPHNTINSIAQTPDGYIWLATWEGLVRFNGADFLTYDLYSDIGLRDGGIQNVRATGDGRLIAVGARGTVVVREQSDDIAADWQQIDAPSTLINKAIDNPDDTFWLATEELGLLKQYADGSVESYFQTHGQSVIHAYDVVKPSDKKLYVATNLGLVRVTKDNVEPFTEADGLPERSVFAVAEHNQQLIVATEMGPFIGDEESGFSLLHPELKGISIIRVMVDTDGDIWLGTIDKGIYRLSKLGLENLSIEHGLPNSRVLSIFQDTENSIWVGTNGGLTRLRETPFHTHTTTDGLTDNFVRTVIQLENGDVWVGSAGGVNRYDGNWTTLDFGRRISVLSMHEHPDYGVFIGTYTDGLLLWKDGEIVGQWQRDDGLLANEVRAISAGADGYVWVATPNGVNRYHPEHGIDAALTQVDGARFSVALLFDSKQQLWLGTARGLFQLIDQVFKQVDLSQFNRAEYIFGITEYQDELWLSTDRGLIIYNPETNQGTSIGRLQGLAVEKVFQVVVDNTDNVWLTSNRGIMRTTLTDVRAVQSGAREKLQTIDIYRESDGLMSSQANGGSNPAILLDQENTVWVPTAHGVARISPARLGAFAQYTPPSVIETIELNSNELKEHDGTIEFDGERISINYAGLGFSMNNQIHFRTQLEGYESGWRYTQSNYAEFTNLPPNHYTFRVQAAYGASDAFGREATFQFVVPPRFYQQIWFWLFASLALTVFVMLFVRMRIGVLQRRAQELEQQVAEKTEALQLQAERFEHLAQYDELTQLPNRRSFNRDLETALAHARRHKRPLTLAIIDVDNFKTINDEHSHACGDATLQWLSKILQQQIRQEDKVARWGGEEFTLLMQDTTIDEAMIIANRIRELFVNTPLPDDIPIKQLTISIGLASTADADSTDSLLSQADKALYHAKLSGRNRVSRFDAI